jgi:hypothetical protein
VKQSTHVFEQSIAVFFDDAPDDPIIDRIVAVGQVLSFCD